MNLNEHIERFKSNENRVDHFVNGSDVEYVVPTTGEPDKYPTQAHLAKLVVQNGLMRGTLYQTKAQLDAALATSSAGEYAVVTDDKVGNTPTEFNGFWQKQNNAWVYLAWNPLASIREEIDQAVMSQDYLTTLSKRNNILPNITFLTRKIVWKLIRGIKVTNADLSFFYRIGYLGIELVNGKYELVIQAHWISKIGYETSGDASATYTFRSEIQIDQGIESVVLTIPTCPVTFVISVDTDQVLTYVDQNIAMWRPENSGYCFIINPKYYDTTGLTGVILERNNVGTTQTPITYDEKYFVDPRETLAYALGSPVRRRPTQRSIHSIRANTMFDFDSLSNARGIMPYPVLTNGTRIPASSITTRVPDSPHAIQLISPRYVTTTGIVSFYLRNLVPIFGTMTGFIEAFVKIPDMTTVDNFTLVLWQNGNVVDFESNMNQVLGSCLPVEAEKIENLTALDLGLNNYTYYSPEDLATWLAGPWVKVKIPVNCNIDLYPDSGYLFALIYNTISGTVRTSMTVKDSDFIMLRGSLKLEHDVSAKFNHRYSHLLKGL